MVQDRSRRRGRIAVAALVWMPMLAAPLVVAGAAVRPGGSDATADATAGGPSVSRAADALTTATPIKHLVFLLQENRSFDNYFGTYPGADGLATDGAGHFTVCVADPATDGGCQKPYHDSADSDPSAPHTEADAVGDIDGGAMDGFVDRARTHGGDSVCRYPDVRHCADSVAVMGYHDAREIPNYWAYAQHYTLADHVLESTPGSSLPSHLYATSEWAGRCASSDPDSCYYDINALRQESDSWSGCDVDPNPVCPEPPVLAWASMAALLDHQSVSWGYYVQKGKEPDCENGDVGEEPCPLDPQDKGTPSIWNPFAFYTDIARPEKLANIQDLSAFSDAAAAGTLPAVSWVIPNNYASEHPPSSIHAGQEHVTDIINAIMQSPQWADTAIVVSWDDWGGFYDHVVPAGFDDPNLEHRGGLRVPMLVISPYARADHIDSEPMSLDSVNRFIEDNWLAGARLDPATDGEYDVRGTVGETRPFVGDLRTAFHFTQRRLDPLILSTNPPPGPPTCAVNPQFACGPPDPAPSSVSPDRLNAGATAVRLTISGSAFGAGATVAVTASGLRNALATKTKYLDPGHLTVTTTVPVDALQRTYDVRVTNPDGASLVCWACLTIDAPLTVTSASPSTLAAGSTTTVTVSGTGFATGVKVTLAGATVRRVRVLDPDTLTANVSVPTGTASGPLPLAIRNTVTGGGGRASCGSCLAVP